MCAGFATQKGLIRLRQAGLEEEFTNTEMLDTMDEKQTGISTTDTHVWILQELGL